MFHRSGSLLGLRTQIAKLASNVIVDTLSTNDFFHVVLVCFCFNKNLQPIPPLLITHRLLSYKKRSNILTACTDIHRLLILKQIFHVHCALFFCNAT